MYIHHQLSSQVRKMTHSDLIFIYLCNIYSSMNIYLDIYVYSPSTLISGSEDDTYTSHIHLFMYYVCSLIIYEYSPLIFISGVEGDVFRSLSCSRCVNVLQTCGIHICIYIYVYMCISARLHKPICLYKQSRFCL
jgi:hypothetical protein